MNCNVKKSDCHASILPDICFKTLLWGPRAKYTRFVKSLQTDDVHIK